MKTKTAKTLIVSLALMLSVMASVKVIKTNYEQLRIEFASHAKGQMQNFINSFIN